MSSTKNQAFIRLSWTDFDAVAHGTGGADVVRRLRRADRSRRLHLLRGLLDEVGHIDLSPLPRLDTAWDLLVRAQKHAPQALDRVLDNPYTGSWAGYATRLTRGQTKAVCPQWIHIGHVHALATAAAIHAGLSFTTRIPVWKGIAVVPGLGMAHVQSCEDFSVAEVHSDGSMVEIGGVRLPLDHSSDGPGWTAVHTLTMTADHRVLTVHLDTVDPYRGLYQPVEPQCLTRTEVDTWHELLDHAWKLIVRLLPEHAEALPAGLDSLVPQPMLPFSNASASTAEAFGSAVIARPADAATLAATLVHEFHHIRLDGLLSLVQLHDDDSRERFYTPWRDDPRPIGGVFQGVYAFFGVTAFWRALFRAEQSRKAAFEFAYWRSGTWRALLALRDDPGLTDAGRRFIDGVAEELEPWQDEPLPSQVTELVAAISADDYAGWRIRYVRPSPRIVAALAESWLTGSAGPITLAEDPTPTTTPDGSWTTARADLVRLSLTDPLRQQNIPYATEADLAFVAGRPLKAIEGYRAKLAKDPDHAASWAGMGLALRALDTNSAAARILLTHPEVVRAVHREILRVTENVPPVDELAKWIAAHTN